jgi:hypothetical protein
MKQYDDNETEETKDEASIRRHGFVTKRVPAGKKPMVWPEDDFDSDRADIDEW